MLFFPNLLHLRDCRLRRRKSCDRNAERRAGNIGQPYLVAELNGRGIAAVLRRKKNYLQTAGLICFDTDRAELSDILARSGVTRITTAGAMSEYFAGEAHDGEYPLRRYTRIVNNE